MLTVLFAHGQRYATHDLLDNGIGRYAALCRRSKDGCWRSKDGAVECRLRTFDVRTTNAGELRLFIEALRKFVDDERALIHVVSMSDELSLSPSACACSLSLCDWCREANARRSLSPWSRTPLFYDR